MDKSLRVILALIIANTICYNASSQSLAVNTTGTAAAASSILDISSTNKGMLVPRMSKTERNAIVAPATGLLVFQNAPDSIGFYYFDSVNWQWLAAASGKIGWATSGNAGTTAANDFLGTIDDVPLSFRQNNKWAGRWNTATGNYFTGDSAGYYTSGINNIAVGSKALLKNTTGYANTSMGSYSLFGNKTGTNNLSSTLGS